MHKLQSLVPVIAIVKSWALFMVSIAETVSTNNRKGDGQQELQEEVSKSFKKREAANKDGRTVRYGTLLWNNTPQFLLRSTVRGYGTSCL